MGTVATVIAGLMLFQGMLYLRRKWYEVFLIGHIILAVFFIIGTWIHVVDFGYMWYIYAAVAFGDLTDLLELFVYFVLDFKRQPLLYYQVRPCEL